MKKEPKECDYCNEEIKGRACWDKKLEGWVCKGCKKLIDNEHLRGK
jgi:hypothetical protein